MFIKSILLYIGSFFGLYTILTSLIVLIFPVSWNEVVSCVGWDVMYMMFGGILCGYIVDDFNSSSYKK